LHRSHERFEYENELSIGPQGIDRERTPHSALHDESIFEFPSVATQGANSGVLDQKEVSPVSDEFALSSMTGLIRYEDLSGFVKLGSGSSASVFKVYHQPSTSEAVLQEEGKKDEKKRVVYAMKKIYVEKQLAKSIIHEVKALYTNRSPHIIKLLDSFYREGAIMMILEYMDCGSLEDVIKISKKIPEKILSRITYQILKGLKYIHEECYIIHRDIKVCI